MEYWLTTGMLEYWNIGILGKKVRISLVCVIIPPFHHSIVPAFSIIPSFQHSIFPEDWATGGISCSRSS
jgi:hypothetical protein